MSYIGNFFLGDGWVLEIIGLVMVAALLATPKRNLSNFLLSLVVLCGLYRQFVIKLEIWDTIEKHPYLFRSSFPTELLAIVTLYFYVQSMTIPGFRFRRSDLWHLIPPAFGLVWYLSLLRWGGESLFRLGPALYKEYALRLAIKVLIAIPYIFLMQRLIGQFGRRAIQHVSDLSHLKLDWLHLLLWIVYIVFIIDLIGAFGSTDILVWHLIPPILFAGLLLLVFFALRYSAVFARELDLEKNESNGEASAEPRLPASQLSPEQLEQQKKRVLTVLEEQALYLNSDLRLSDLATAAGLKSYRLSEVLNRGLGQNFYDLVNQYRVKKAQELLKGPQADRFNLLGVAMESGFKSKSVFNDVFKKTTGKTPSEFRASSPNP